MPAELTNEEWRQLFEDLRLEVINLGFGDWDRHAALAMEDLDASEATIAYLRAFIDKQQRGTKGRLESLRDRLGKQVNGPDGSRVETAVLVDNRFDRDGEYDLLRQIAPTDDFVQDLTEILNFLDAGDEGALP